MMHSINQDDLDSSGDDDDSSSSVEIFSPGRARRTSLHYPTPTPKKHLHQQQEALLSLSPPTASSSMPPLLPQIPRDNDSLPRLQDNSWIGARVSPIPPLDDDSNDDDDDDDDHDIENDKKTLSSSPPVVMISSFKNHNSNNKNNDDYYYKDGPTERSSLLGKNRKNNNNNQNGTTQRLSSNVKNSRHRGRSSSSTSSSTKRRRRSSSKTTNADTKTTNARLLLPSNFEAKLVVGTTGMYFACIILHDVYLWYLLYRKGIEPKYSISWKLPWLMPSKHTLVRFGAFAPSKMMTSIVQQQEGGNDGNGSSSSSSLLLLFLSSSSYSSWWWRPFTSLFLSSSLLEWCVIVWSWLIELQSISLGKYWFLLYVISTWTGQLWMVAFHPYGISGCCSWGTCGILCAMGVIRPDKRFSFFIVAIILLLINLLQPNSSAFGAIGSSFFGWSLYGVGLNPFGHDEMGRRTVATRERHCLNWLAIFLVIKLWVLPILILIRRDNK